MKRFCKQRNCKNEVRGWGPWCGFHKPRPPSDPEIIVQLDKLRKQREAGR